MIRKDDLILYWPPLSRQGSKLVWAHLLMIDECLHTLWEAWHTGGARKLSPYPNRSMERLHLQPPDLSNRLRDPLVNSDIPSLSEPPQHQSLRVGTRMFKMTDVEFLCCREQGFYFYCDENFHLGHCCKRRLQTLLVCEDDDYSDRIN